MEETKWLVCKMCMTENYDSDPLLDLNLSLHGFAVYKFSKAVKFCPESKKHNNNNTPGSDLLSACSIDQIEDKSKRFGSDHAND